MKVSIVIPAYNEEKFLEPSIRAALAQEYPNVEVIVVNNVSTDNTVAIAERFPVKLIHEPRKGLPYARQAGLDAATGEIVANMDADCLPDPDWISRGVIYFNNAKVVAVSGPYYFYDGGKTFRTIFLWGMKYVSTAVNMLAQWLKIGAVLVGGNTLLRKSSLQSVGGYNTAIEFWGEDNQTAKRISKAGRVVYDKNLIMKSSARRFQSQGVMSLLKQYIGLYIRDIFSKK